MVVFHDLLRRHKDAMLSAMRRKTLMAGDSGYHDDRHEERALARGGAARWAVLDGPQLLGTLRV